MARVSFIIPAHDEEDQLPRTLDAIARAAAALTLDHEVIVAADGCTDRTEDIARERGAAVVSHARRQIAATRNLGARAAKGQVLFFIDADTAVNPASVGEALDLLARGAAGGGAPVRFDGAVPFHACVLLRALNLSFRLARLTGGCFLFCTRRAFDATGGWDESLYASEEITMATALKRSGPFRIVRTPVLTSGRKLRLFGARDFLALGWAGLRTRGRFVQSRDDLDLWYGPRAREKPPGAG